MMLQKSANCDIFLDLANIERSLLNTFADVGSLLCRYVFVPTEEKFAKHFLEHGAHFQRRYMRSVVVSEYVFIGILKYTT